MRARPAIALNMEEFNKKIDKAVRKAKERLAEEFDITMEQIDDIIDKKIDEELGKAVDADIVKIPLHYLRLDPKNVRFKHMERALSDKELEEEIWKDGDSKSLLREIKFSRGLSDMPFVKKITDNEYLVIEGNRRTTCLRKLAAEINSKKEKDIPRERIDPVECVVFPSDIKDKDIATNTK